MHEQGVAHVHEVVSAGAVDGPVLTQELAVLQNLLSDNPRLRSTRAQLGEVLPRVAEAIGMIDAHSVKDTPIEPIEDTAVHGFEDMRPLHAQTDQRIDVEETPVAEFLVGGAPERQPVVLQIQNVIQCIDVAVYRVQLGLNRRTRLWSLIAKAVK